MPKVNFLDLMRSHNKSYEDIFIVKGLSSEDMFGFSDIVETQEENQGLRTFGKKSHDIVLIFTPLQSLEFGLV